MSTPPFPPIDDDTLLLCVDMQPAFLRVMPDAESLQRRCEFTVACAVGLGIPVAFTEQVPEKLGGTLPELLGLAPQASVWPKNTFSALADEGIHDAITLHRDVRHIV